MNGIPSFHILQRTPLEKKTGKLEIQTFECRILNREYRSSICHSNNILPSVFRKAVLWTIFSIPQSGPLDKIRYSAKRSFGQYSIFRKQYSHSPIFYLPLPHYETQNPLHPAFYFFRLYCKCPKPGQPLVLESILRNRLQFRHTRL